jgi:surface-anchored protein
MKHLLYLTSVLTALSTPSQLGSQCYTFTHEHVDLLSIQWNAPSNTVSLMASDDDHGMLYASNQCVVLCPESMRFTLPGSTPLGNEGDPLWILPQNPYPGVPYLGVSAEALPPGWFIDSLTIQLTRVEGPGHFLVWQSTGFGSFDIKMDTRDGIGADDKLTPFVGGHEHHNWGFTTNGIYRAYFQVIARRPGQTTNLVSAETPFTFHVLPLRPFETWTATNWPCESAPDIMAAGANPDADAGVNAIEYALGTDPKVLTTEGWPSVSLVTTNGQTYCALTYTRVKSATDCDYEVVASSDLLSPDWEPLTVIHTVVDRGADELVTVRDDFPVPSHEQRFFRFQVRIRP